MYYVLGIELIRFENQELYNNIKISKIKTESSGKLLLKSLQASYMKQKPVKHCTVLKTLFTGSFLCCFNCYFIINLSEKPYMYRSVLVLDLTYCYVCMFFSVVPYNASKQKTTRVPAIDTNNDIVPPLDFSFYRVSNVNGNIFVIWMCI